LFGTLSLFPAWYRPPTTTLWRWWLRATPTLPPVGMGVKLWPRTSSSAPKPRFAASARWRVNSGTAWTAAPVCRLCTCTIVRSADRSCITRWLRASSYLGNKVCASQPCHPRERVLRHHFCNVSRHPRCLSWSIMSAAILRHCAAWRVHRNRRRSAGTDWSLLIIFAKFILPCRHPS
jgi:hypothetical protein